MTLTCADFSPSLQSSSWVYWSAYPNFHTSIITPVLTTAHHGLVGQMCIAQDRPILQLIYLFPGPYTSKQRSSKALTMSLETCPKNVADIVACTGFENANARSSVTSVGPAWSFKKMGDSWDVCDDLGRGSWPALGWGEDGDAGWKRHVVESVLNSGEDEDATAYRHIEWKTAYQQFTELRIRTSTERYGVHVTLLM